MQGVIETTSGRVQGSRVGDLWHYAGLPYARPPVGPLRWRPPQPPVPWTGVRPAGGPGPIAPQPPPTPWNGVPGDPANWDEDCLSLNVWTPGPDGSRRPIMVWIHGGAFVAGSGASALYRGETLARRGDVVVVTINYRLGALGFLAHEALADPSTGAAGNWGLLDQLAAVDWVRENAAAFGGDPANVTVFGESAGGMSIAALLASPRAEGSFRRAVVQSGPPHAVTLDEAGAVCERLATELGLDGVDRDRLAEVPAADIVAAQERAAAAGGLGFAPTWLPVVDGAVLCDTPLAAVTAGAGAGVDLLIGTNLDETSFFAAADPRVAKLEEEKLARFAGTLSRAAEREDGGAPAEGSALLEAYRQARGARGESTRPAALWTAITSDAVFRLPSLSLAARRSGARSPTYCYLFTWPSPLMGGALGSAHSVEIPFVFGTLDAPRMHKFAGSGPEAEELAERMQDAWLAFARHGDPSTEALGPWPPYGRGERPTMVLDRSCGVQPDPRGAERRAW